VSAVQGAHRRPDGHDPDLFRALTRLAGAAVACIFTSLNTSNSALQPNGKGRMNTRIAAYGGIG
jgi:hypothetical protein